MTKTEMLMGRMTGAGRMKKILELGEERKGNRMGKIPYFKAATVGNGRIVEGFYAAHPETTYCFTEDYERNPVKIIHCIITHKMTDWSLPNKAECYQIDPDTLEQIGWFDISRKVYGTENWYESITEDGRTV